MKIKITDSDNISTIHIPERLEVNLLSAAGIIEDIEMNIYFNVETKLPNGQNVGQAYWDSKPLKLNCKDNPSLAEAMRVIQKAIGEGRYEQITAPIPEPIEGSGMLPLKG